MPKVLILHTGGTLGMRGEPLEPSDYTDRLLEHVPELGALAEVDSRVICNLDSSDIGPAHWRELAETIALEYASFDGFVIVHGTDTMSYSASALAFALEGLSKPVILTGAQRPLVEIRTDARRNLLDAVELATRAIPEVGICFDGLLLRGCRSQKSNAHDYRAFDSPGCEPLARLGVTVDIGPHVRQPQRPFRCDARFDARVLAVHMTPGLDASLLRAALLRQGDAEHPPLGGLVLSVFGVGTVPTRRGKLAGLLAEAHASGLEIVAITPSSGRIDLTQYLNSAPLVEAGVIPGGSMQLAAATTKLMHALATCSSPSERRAYMEWNVAGELG